MRWFGVRTHHSCAIPCPNAAGGCSIAVAVAFGLKLTTCHSCSDFGHWYSWRVESGTGRAFVLKQSSYRPEGQHLMLEGLKAFIAPGRIWRWTWWTLHAVSLQEHRAYGSIPWFEQGICHIDRASEAKYFHKRSIRWRSVQIHFSCWPSEA